jgi:PPOX class probable F420-dependent enzyme
VPFTFALDEDVIYSAIDAKPKSTRALKRLDNIRRDPRVTVLVDHYDDDWSRLWWCRLEGGARVLEDDAEIDRGRDLLVAKYPPYRSRPPAGPWIVVSVQALAGWASSA